MTKHKLESRLLGQISITSDKQMTPPLWQKVKRKNNRGWLDGITDLKDMSLSDLSGSW